MFQPPPTAGYQGYQPNISRISRPFVHRISWVVTPCVSRLAPLVLATKRRKQWVEYPQTSPTYVENKILCPTANLDDFLLNNHVKLTKLESGQCPLRRYLKCEQADPGPHKDTPPHRIRDTGPVKTFVSEGWRYRRQSRGRETEERVQPLSWALRGGKCRRGSHVGVFRISFDNTDKKHRNVAVKGYGKVSAGYKCMSVSILPDGLGGGRKGGKRGGSVGHVRLCLGEWRKVKWSIHSFHRQIFLIRSRNEIFFRAIVYNTFVFSPRKKSWSLGSIP